MSANYDYVVELAHEFSGPKCRFLDFGCGGAQALTRAVDAGMDAWGVDRFEPDWTNLLAKPSQSVVDRIRTLSDDDLLPFEDQSFNVVIANMVFEHIEDFTVPLAEIKRVLKQDGHIVLIFPTWELWREGHVGLLFAHRFAKNSALRNKYFTLAHRLGFGRSRENMTTSEWVRHMEHALDELTFYKTIDEVHLAITKAELTIKPSMEGHHLAFRLDRKFGTKFFHSVVQLPGIRSLANLLGSRALFRVIHIQK